MRALPRRGRLRRAARLGPRPRRDDRPRGGGAPGPPRPAPRRGPGAGRLRRVPRRPRPAGRAGARGRPARDRHVRRARLARSPGGGVGPRGAHLHDVLPRRDARRERHEHRPHLDGGGRGRGRLRHLPRQPAARPPPLEPGVPDLPPGHRHRARRDRRRGRPAHRRRARPRPHGLHLVPRLRGERRAPRLHHRRDGHGRDRGRRPSGSPAHGSHPARPPVRHLPHGPHRRPALRRHGGPLVEHARRERHLGPHGGHLLHLLPRRDARRRRHEHAARLDGGRHRPDRLRHLPRQPAARSPPRRTRRARAATPTP